MAIRSCKCNCAPSAPRYLVIFASNESQDNLHNNIQSRRHGRTGFCLPCGQRRALNYDTPPVQVQFPRLSLCLSRSVRHGRGWGTSRRLGATAPLSALPLWAVSGRLAPAPLLSKLLSSLLSSPLVALLSRMKYCGRPAVPSGGLLVSRVCDAPTMLHAANTKISRESRIFTSM